MKGVENQSWKNNIYLIGGPGRESYVNRREEIIREKK